jgi:hypothetical protein
VLIDITRFGIKPPPLPKGETECRYTGIRNRGRHDVILTTDVTVLTGPARATFDSSWASSGGGNAPGVSPVPGVGDGAAWDPSQLTLVGYAGTAAFVVTLEPLPASAFPPATAKSMASAIARLLIGRL